MRVKVWQNPECNHRNMFTQFFTKLNEYWRCNECGKLAKIYREVPDEQSK